MATATLSDRELLLLIDEHIGRLEDAQLAATRAACAAIHEHAHAINDHVRWRASRDLDVANRDGVRTRGGIAALKALRVDLRERGVR